MRHSRLGLALFAATLAFAALVIAAPARAEIVIRIDKAAQRMTVTVDGAQRYAWPVSTGVRGYDTPAGEFKPFRMERDHFSREWDDAPMPHSIFFTKQGHAIHGSGHIRAIGTPASHGCVRLEPKNASILFGLVKEQGMSNTRVVLNGEAPASVPVARRDRDDRRSTSNDDDDEGFTAILPPQRAARSWREYDDAAPAYDYRERPYYPRRYYRSSGAPFPLLFGR
jgi:hypothetical protein